MHLKPEWQTPPNGDFARYVERLNADAALHEAIERRRQRERQRPAQGMAQRPAQKTPTQPAPRPATHTAPQPAPRTATRPSPRPVPAAASPAQTSAFVGKVILGVIVAFIALMLLSEDGGMDFFGFFVIAFIAWRVFFSGRDKDKK